MPEIEYIEWRVGLDNPWFKDFASKIYSSYRFDRSGGANDLRWELDLINPQDRHLIVSFVNHLVKKYAWLTKREHHGGVNTCTDCGHPVKSHAGGEGGACKVKGCDSPYGSAGGVDIGGVAAYWRENFRGKLCANCHPYGDKLVVFVPNTRGQNSIEQVYYHIMGD